MNALFDSLTRGRRYEFVFGPGQVIRSAVFHGYLPDGTLRVANADGEYHLNPHNISWAKSKSNAT